MKILNGKLIFLTIIIIFSRQISGQDKFDDPKFDIIDGIAEAKMELKGTEVGQQLELWHNSFKANNIKLKMLFDEEGFVIMLKMVSLGNRLIRDNAHLESSDVNNILSFISAAERLGCEAPSGLKDKINISLYKSIGKNWKEYIRQLKGN